MEALQFLTADDLEEFGVKKIQKRMIMARLKNLTASVPSQQASTVASKSVPPPISPQCVPPFEPQEVPLSVEPQAVPSAVEPQSVPLFADPPGAETVQQSEDESPGPASAELRSGRRPGLFTSVGKRVCSTFDSRFASGFIRPIEKLSWIDLL